VWRQYDHQLFLNTVEGPGGDAAVLRLKAPGLPPSERALAISTDGNNRWCSIDPRQGTAMVVAESALNVACAGARPIALVNCLNFGNPEHPEVMWQLSEAIDGMGEACRALGIPVIGGNVSLYNESRGRDIDPTPVVGVLGLIDRLERRPPGVGLVDGGALLLLGDPSDDLGGSRWLELLHGHSGPLPALDLSAHARLMELVPQMVADGLMLGIHDVSDGGLGLALAEMAVRSGIGFEVDAVRSHAELFSEAPSRVVVCVAEALVAEMTRRSLGRAGGNRIVIGELVDVNLHDATQSWISAIPAMLEYAPVTG
jgi:phosphoribosylformylglycinamidine (FGAM) synthase-like enzyme